MKIKIAIGIVSLGSIKTRTVYDLCKMLKSFPYEYEMIFKEGGALHSNREQMAQMAVDSGCTHLFFIDSDMSFESDALMQLLERDKDIIGTHYNHRKLPLQTTVLEFKENRDKRETLDALHKVEGLATGFLLIKTEVFKKMPHPWFFWKVNEKGEPTMGEDFWFCEKARESGFDIWVDLTVSIKHIGNQLF
jgi:hypothetical protein